MEPDVYDQVGLPPGGALPTPNTMPPMLPGLPTHMGIVPPQQLPMLSHMGLPPGIPIAAK